jgi:hypothetical protein
MRTPIAALLVLVALVAGCSSGTTAGPSGSPGASPGTSPGASVPTGPIDNAEAAVAAVLATDPRFDGIRPLDPDLIGQSAWTTVEPTSDGWTVVVRIGWGDCPAGCIDEHTWTYAVSTAGEVTLMAEVGPEVPLEGAPES